MAVIRFNPVGTITPKIDSTQLQPGVPSAALNNNSASAALTTFKDPLQGSLMTKSGALRSIFEIDGYWIPWVPEVDVVRGEVADTDPRFFYTGDSYPKQAKLSEAVAGGDPSTYPVTVERLGVPAPSAAPVIEIQGTADDSLDDVDVSYYYTYVTLWGEESAPGPATAVTTIPGGKYTRLNDFKINEVTDTQVDVIRVYRIAVGSGGSAEYQLVKVRPVSNDQEAVYDVTRSQITSDTVFVYDSDSAVTPTGLNQELGEVCPTEDWDQPDDDLANLVQFQNGILAGSVGNEVCISEPLIPYAWPVSYRKTLNDDVVGLGVYGEALIALTDSYPYVIQGTAPERMTLKKLPYKAACLSRRGIVSTRTGVVYPGPDGMMLATPTGLVNLTDRIFTREQWNAGVSGPGGALSDIVAAYYDGEYYAFFEGTSYGFKLAQDTNSGVSLIKFKVDDDLAVYDLHVEPTENALHFLAQYQSGSYYIYEWDAGASSLSYSFTSKKFQFRYNNFGVLQVRGDQSTGDPLTVTLVGTPGYSPSPITVTDENFVRLPSTEEYNSLTITLAGVPDIREVVVADTPEELNDV